MSWPETLLYQSVNTSGASGTRPIPSGEDKSLEKSHSVHLFAIAIALETLVSSLEAIALSTAEKSTPSGQ